MMNSWDEYLATVQENADCEYEQIQSFQVKRLKERIAGNATFDNYVIGATNTSREVICFDTEKNKVEHFGKTKIGTFKWTGIVYYQEKMFCLPRKENSILIIDPKKRICEEKSLNINYHGEHHYSGVVTDKGLVYQPPRDENHILVIDLNDFTTRKIQIAGNNEKRRYSSVVLHPDNKVYFIPEFGCDFLVMDMITEEIKVIPANMNSLVFGAVVAYDKNIYGYCKEGQGLLKINTKDDKIEWICGEIGNPDCYGSIVGINGKIYSVPAGGNSIYEFDVKTQKARKIFTIEDDSIAKCAGAALGNDGSIVMLPCFGGKIYKLSCNKNSSKFDVSRNGFLNTNY